MRILGAGENGSYLDLPANLTADDREVAFTVPEQRSGPLPAGSFVVQLSLNGGADFSGGPAPSEQVHFGSGSGPGHGSGCLHVDTGIGRVSVSVWSRAC